MSCLELKNTRIEYIVVAVGLRMGINVRFVLYNHSLINLIIITESQEASQSV